MVATLGAPGALVQRQRPFATRMPTPVGQRVPQSRVWITRWGMTMGGTETTATETVEATPTVVRARSAAARRAALTVQERSTSGRARRQEVPRSSHAAWDAPADRPDPIALLLAQDEDQARVPELTPIRYGRMLASPFAFLRGSATVMASDLSRTPITGFTVQASGDAHLLNFGVFGTQERNLVFGMNDFDETLPGPWEWDVKRLAASFVVAGRDGGVGEGKARDAARAAVRSYRERISEYAGYGALEVWYATIDTSSLLEVLSPEVRERAKAIIAKARTRTNLQVLEKTTELIDGDFRIIPSPPLVVRDHRPINGRPVTEVVQAWLDGYRASLAADRRRLIDRYQVVDAVRKVVGVGSVGTRCYVVLLRGNSDRDVLFLQVKEATTSVLEAHTAPGRHDYHGRRVVEGQRLIQPAPDIFLGWGRLTNRQGHVLDYYVRQLRDMKGSVTIEPGNVRAGPFVEYAVVCGWALALAHARSGDAATIAGYLGPNDRFDEAVARFATAYADQTERDHAALVAAVRQGRVSAELDR